MIYTPGTKWWYYSWCLDGVCTCDSAKAVKWANRSESGSANCPCKRSLKLWIVHFWMSSYNSIFVRRYNSQLAIGWNISNGMRMDNKIGFVFIWFIGYLIGSVHCYRFQPNTMTLNNFTDCAKSEDDVVAHFNCSITIIARNKYLLNGEVSFDVIDDVPMEVFDKYY